MKTKAINIINYVVTTALTIFFIGYVIKTIGILHLNGVF